jgi:hypothetical protein
MMRLVLVIALLTLCPGCPLGNAESVQPPRMEPMPIPFEIWLISPGKVISTDPCENLPAGVGCA